MDTASHHNDTPVWARPGSLGLTIAQRLLRPGVIAAPASLARLRDPGAIAEPHHAFVASLSVAPSLQAAPAAAGDIGDDPRVFRGAAPHGTVWADGRAQPVVARAVVRPLARSAGSGIEGSGGASASGTQVTASAHGGPSASGSTATPPGPVVADASPAARHGGAAAAPVAASRAPAPVPAPPSTSPHGTPVVAARSPAPLPATASASTAGAPTAVARPSWAGTRSGGTAPLARARAVAVTATEVPPTDDAPSAAPFRSFTDSGPTPVATASRPPQGAMPMPLAHAAAGETSGPSAGGVAPGPVDAPAAVATVLHGSALPGARTDEASAAGSASGAPPSAGSGAAAALPAPDRLGGVASDGEGVRAVARSGVIATTPPARDPAPTAQRAVAAPAPWTEATGTPLAVAHRELSPTGEETHARRATHTTAPDCAVSAPAILASRTARAAVAPAASADAVAAVPSRSLAGDAVPLPRSSDDLPLAASTSRAGAPDIPEPGPASSASAPAPAPQPGTDGAAHAMPARAAPAPWPMRSGRVAPGLVATPAAPVASRSFATPAMPVAARSSAMPAMALAQRVSGPSALPVGLRSSVAPPWPEAAAPAAAPLHRAKMPDGAARSTAATLPVALLADPLPPSDPPAASTVRHPDAAGAAMPPGGTAVDLDDLVERACEAVFARLVIEHERRGFSRWA